jgi:hypothetical protein
MNKKVLIIGGGILVIGVGAYLYFTKKDKKEALSSGSATPSTSGATTPTTSSTTTSSITSPINSEIPPLSTGGIVTPTTKAPTIQEQENLDIANDIVVKIKQFEKMSAIKQSQINFWKPSTFSRIKPINTYPSAINKLKDDLLKLGYEYKGTTDGVLVKL